MFSRAFHFLTWRVLMSRFRFICQTDGSTVAPFGTADLGVTVKLPLPI